MMESAGWTQRRSQRIRRPSDEKKLEASSDSRRSVIEEEREKPNKYLQTVPDSERPCRVSGEQYRDSVQSGSVKRLGSNGAERKRKQSAVQ